MLFVLPIAAIGSLLLQGRYPVADNAMFAYAGRAIAEGRLLYVNVWDNKLPGVYYVNALWQILFGQRYVLHAAAEICIALLSGTLLALVLRSLSVRAWLPTPVVLVLLLCLALPLNTTEAYALPLLLAAVLAARHAFPFLSGVLVGIAAMFWVPSVLMCLPLSLLVPRRSWPALGLGTLAPLLALFAALAWMLHHSGLVTLIRSWTAYVSTPPNTAAHHRLTFLNRFAALWSALSNLWVGSIAAGATPLFAILLGTLRRPATQAQRFGLYWTAAMLAGTFTGTRFYSHYFIPSLAAMLFTISAYGARKFPSIVWISALCVSAFFAIRTFQEVRTIWFVTDARSALAARVAAVMGPIVDGKFTLQVDSYRPELYLALNPKLRSRYEIVARANGPFLGNAIQALPEADIRVSTSGDAEPGVRICAKTSRPWRIFASRSVASQFAACP